MLAQVVELSGRRWRRIGRCGARGCPRKLEDRLLLILWVPKRTLITVTRPSKMCLFMLSLFRLDANPRALGFGAPRDGRRFRATFGLNNGSSEYENEISCGRNSHRIVLCREHAGNGSQVLGTRGYCQSSASAGQG